MECRDRSITPNSMMVIERGAGGISTLIGPSSSSSRPPSGRHSRNVTPIQRSGSQLEVLPPNDGEDKSQNGSRSSSRSSVRPSSRSGSADSPRQSHSAGSSGRRPSQGQESSVGVKRASSMDAVPSPQEEAGRPASGAHKEISLTTVKRNYESHGIPKNQSWEFVPKDLPPFPPPVTNGISPSQVRERVSLGASCGVPDDNGGVETDTASGGNKDDASAVVSEEERTEQRLKYLMEELSVKTDGIQVGSGNASRRRGPTTALPKAPPFLEDQKRAQGTEKVKGPADEVGQDDDDSDDEDDEEEDDDEEGPAAPIELMGEFLDAIMEEDYESADKLCKMILIYEPDNEECLQFKPLIEEMLQREWHHQLWGSDSEDDSDDDDDDDDNDEEDDDSDEDGEDDSESDSSESAEEDGEDDETTDKKGNSVMKMPGEVS